MFARLAGSAAMSAGGYLFGQYAQDRVGGPAAPTPGAPPQGGPGQRPLTEQYGLEQQTNQFYPPGRSFMGAGIWGAGNVLGPIIPDAVMAPMVGAMSAPSNPDADRNRAIAAAAPLALAGGPVVGPLAAAAGGFLSGTESRARQQAAQVPRVTPPAVSSDPAAIARGYAGISQEYRAAGLAPQSAVTRLMPPARENAAVSAAIYENLTGTPSNHFRPGDA